MKVKRWEGKIEKPWQSVEGKIGIRSQKMKCKIDKLDFRIEE